MRHGRYERQYERKRRSRSPSEDRHKRSHERHERHDRHQHSERHQHHDRHQHYDRHERHRSKSREKKGEFLYEERKQEEKDQKIRLAIRNDTLNFDPALMESFMGLSEEKRRELSTEAHTPSRINEFLLVRELYVSGLSQTGEESIKQFFGRYGQIEGVEIIKNFVFVKYFKVEDASNACTDYHNINATLHQTHNPNFKIFFADNFKRSGVVSNSTLHEVKSQLIPVVYVSVKNDSQYTNQQYLMGIFNRFGFVRGFDVKKNVPHTQRTYALVEYETMTMALRARDKLRAQSERLGDRKSEITLLIDNRKIMQIHPSIATQMLYQDKKLQRLMLASQQQVAVPEGDHNDTDRLMNLIKWCAEKKEDEEEQGASADWFGLFTRNKRLKVEVDFYRIHKEPFELDSVLNVAYRGSLDQVLQRRDIALAGRFKSANTSNDKAFAQYISYFSRRKRSGIIFTKGYVIHLLPPLPYLPLPYPISPTEMLGLFFRVN